MSYEYTILALLSILDVFLIDRLVKTRLFSRPKFWVFQGICFVLQFFLDGYLTWRPIYIVNPEKILGIYLFTTPLENFLFGFSMLSLAVIVYERLGVKNKKGRSHEN
jgi:lycopene cyclase domain-containing protein